MKKFPDRMKVYILGPMRGFTLYNFPAFDDMAVRLRDAGYEPVNPAELDREETGFNPYALGTDHDWSKLPASLSLSDIIQRDTKAIQECAAYVALPGWEKSVGATAEKALLDWQNAIRLDPDNSFAFWMDPNLREKMDAASGHAFADDTNPKDRIGVAKPQLHLIPPALEIWTAKALENGAEKYGAYNWREKKVRLTVYISAARRHLSALLDGEDCADDSGLPHEAHIAACMGILLDARATGNLIDDRPPKGTAAKLIKDLTRPVSVDAPKPAA